MKKLVVPFLIAVIAALIVVVAQRTMCSAGGAMDLSQLHSAAFLTRALGLNEAQAAEVQKLQSAYSEQLDACCSSHCEARMKLGDALFRSSDTNAAAAVIESMCKSQAASEMATIEHIRKVHSILTPDQQKKYEDLVTACVCGSCPIGFKGDSK